MSQLQKVKTRLRITGYDEDDLITQLLEDAMNDILDYCNRDTLTTPLEGLQRELAIVYYQRLGSEGEASRSEGGISVSYITDIPSNIKSRLNAYRLLKLSKVAKK